MTPSARRAILARCLMRGLHVGSVLPTSRRLGEIQGISGPGAWKQMRRIMHDAGVVLIVRNGRLVVVEMPPP
jgi:hypothetical protein